MCRSGAVGLRIGERHAGRSLQKIVLFRNGLPAVAVELPLEFPVLLPQLVCGIFAAQELLDEIGGQGEFDEGVAHV